MESVSIEKQSINKTDTFLYEVNIERQNDRREALLLSALIEDLINEFADVFTVVKGNCQLSLIEVCENHTSLNEYLNNILRVTEKGALLLRKLDALLEILREREWNQRGI
jgi:superfamily II DNA/RNA helicase